MLAERKFKKGSYVFIEGDENSDSVFLVRQGRVSHVCASAILSRALKDACEGDFFGFISSFSGRPRLSSAIAVEDTVAVEIESNQLFSMLSDKPQIAMKIMNSYSHTLQEYDNVLMDIKPISLLYPQSMSLLSLGEYYMEKGDNTLAEYIFNRYIQLYPDSDNIADIKKNVAGIESSAGSCMSSVNDRGELLYRDRGIIFCEHEPGDYLYFIDEGKVKISKQSRNRDILLAVLGEGEIFGELAILSRTPRSATAVSFGGVKVTPVDMDKFSELITDSPALVKKIITSISQRLWFNHIRLSIMSYRNPVTRLFAFLEGKLMEDGVSLARKTPHIFQFGLDELIDMNELSAENDSDVISELVDNRFLSFNFGTITVSNPKDFCSDVQFYKQRDRIPSLRRKPAPVPDDVSAGNTEQSLAADEFAPSSEETASGPRGFIDEMIAEIIPELNSEDPSKRSDAVIRLGSLGEKGSGSVPMLLQRIGEINSADSNGITGLLIKSLSDDSPAVRSSAARSIGYLGLRAEEAAPHIIKLLSDRDSAVRILAVNSLEKITGREYLNEVIEAVKNSAKNDTDRFVQNSAREVLMKLNRRKKTR